MYILLAKNGWRQQLTVSLALACLLLGLPSIAVSQQGKIITIDVPGASGTVVTSINEEGAVAGYYFDPQFGLRGFVRSEEGTFTTFDSGYVFAINEQGAVTGYSGQQGYVRSRRGSFVTFNALGNAIYTIPLTINEDGAVAGQYVDANYSQFGFIRKPNGTMIKVAPPGTFFISVNSINDDGVATGYNINAAGGAPGFVRSGSGSITEFDVQGAGFVNPQSINAYGTIAGYYDDGTGEHAFVRDQQGTITTFDCSGSNETFALGINDQGAIAGYCAPEGHFWVGFLRDRIGTLTMFDLPGAVYPFAPDVGRLGIDAHGTVAGTYYDANNGSHGFVRRP